MSIADCLLEQPAAAERQVVVGAGRAAGNKCSGIGAEKAVKSPRQAVKENGAYPCGLAHRRASCSRSMSLMTRSMSHVIQPDTRLAVRTVRYLGAPVPIYAMKQSARLSARELPFELVRRLPRPRMDKESLDIAVSKTTLFYLASALGTEVSDTGSWEPHTPSPPRAGARRARLPPRPTR